MVYTNFIDFGYIHSYNLVMSRVHNTYTGIHYELLAMLLVKYSLIEESVDAGDYIIRVYCCINTKW